MTLVENFKKQCQCVVEVSNAGDAGLLVERLELSHKDQFDLVIGLDQVALADAEKKIQWREILFPQMIFATEVAPHLTSHFVPYDWAPMTFIYRKDDVKPPTSLNDLLSDEYRSKIAIQDPRSSTPGFDFFQWVRAVEKDHAADYLEKLKPNIQSISPSWSFSYGLFKKGLAKLVFSYVTSLVYHWDVEADHHYQAASFPEGHPYQVEFAAIPAGCTECGLAEQFLKTMMSKEGQKLIAQKNFMLPAVSGVELSPSYSQLPKLKLIETPTDKDLSVWARVFRK
jgi:thiamine transport system substrate-binding protein